ncbi:MAG TPA: IS21 family transposase [Gammaproteobacteria bacterium]
MNKILEVLRMKSGTELSERRIGELLSLSPTTVARYWRIFKDKGYDLAELEKLTYEELDRKFNSAFRRLVRKRMPDWDYIHRAMKQKYETLQRLWEEYCLAGPGDAYSRSQFGELYRNEVMKLDVVMRQTHLAGQCIFVDFCGQTVSWTDPETGVVHQMQIFIAVMGCSNYTFILAVPDQSLKSWIHAHNKMYEFFGGVAEAVTSDNLKAAVIKAGRDMKLNKTYFELGKHYRTIILPARPGKPRDKAKVESGVRFVYRVVLAALKNRSFFSPEEINQSFEELLVRLNERPFKRLPGSRKSWFEDLDKPALRPLPAEPFEYAEWRAPQKVPNDYHVMVDKHYYSVPCALIHSIVEARVTQTTVEFYQGGRRVATHAVSNVIGGQTTAPEHQPPSHRAYAEQTPALFQEWAMGIGPAALAVVQEQFASKPHTQIGIRACAQLKGLGRTYGPDRLEAACRRAQAIESLTVKSVQSILKSGRDQIPPDDDPLPPHLPPHQNIRGSDYYAGR